MSKRSGQRCMRWAVLGANVCPIHGGKSPRLVAKLERDRALAALEAEAVSILEGQGLGMGERDITPTEVMLEQVRKAAFNVAKYEWLVGQLNMDAEASEGGPIVVMDETGVATVAPAHLGAGIATRTDPSNWKAAPHVIVAMYNDERDRLMRYAKMCRDANVEERLVVVAEQQAGWVTSILDAVFAALVLTPDQEARLPEVIETTLAALPAGGA